MSISFPIPISEAAAGRRLLQFCGGTPSSDTPANDPAQGAANASANVPALRVSDAERARDWITQMFALEKGRTSVEIGTQSPTPRLVHRYSTPSAFHTLPDPDGFMLGSHLELIRAGSHLYVRDIGTTPKAEEQQSFIIRGSQPFVRPTNLMLYRPEENEISLLELFCEKQPKEVRAIYREGLLAQWPLIDRHPYPLQNGDFLFVAGHVLPIQGIPERPESAALEPDRRDRAEAERYLAGLREIIVMMDPEVEQDPYATKLMPDAVVTFRMLLEPAFLNTLNTHLVKVYGFEPQEAKALTQDLRSQATQQMEALYAVRQNIPDVSRKACIVNPATLPVHGQQLDAQG